MKICLVTADFYPNVGGVAAHVVELGKALAELGHTVSVVTLPLGNEDTLQQEWQGMQVFRPRIPKQRPFYNVLLKRWLSRFVREQGVEVVHVHGMRPLEATRGLPCPVIFTNHTSGFLKRLQAPAQKYRKLATRLSHVDHVIAPSQELCDATVQVGYTGPVTFISNGVDARRFHPIDRGEPSSEPVVLLARRLVEKNGVRVFAKAMTHLKEIPLRIRIAGDGPEREAVNRILDEGGMLPRTEFLGSVNNADMPGIYQNADISVLPSFMEATSITGLESMACGIPLVGTSVGGIPAIISNNITGLLVEPGHPEEMARAIGQLVMHPEERVAMGKAARQRVESEFAWPIIAQKTLDIYQLSQESSGHA